MNPEEEFEEKRRQRADFLCEVYKRIEGDSSKYVPYDQIAMSLSFQKDAIDQACLYLEREQIIEIYSNPLIEVIPPEGRTVVQPQSAREKLIFITDKGISYARKICTHDHIVPNETL